MQRSADPIDGEKATGPAVLIVEDEPGIVDFVRRGFGAEGFAVQAATDGARANGGRSPESFDAVVLDLMLPGPRRSGDAATLRSAKPGLPVIVLTARGELEERIAGLDAGAVDYLVKPFSLAELAARVRAQLRAAAQSAGTTLRGPDIEVDLLTRKVRRDGATVRSRATEFELLAYLLRHRGQVLSREQILERGVGLRARSGHERGRRLHRLPAPQAAPAATARRRSSRCAPSATAWAMRASAAAWHGLQPCAAARSGCRAWACAGAWPAG